jgi:hypothetical protein
MGKIVRESVRTSRLVDSLFMLAHVDSGGGRLLARAGRPLRLSACRHGAGGDSGGTPRRRIEENIPRYLFRWGSQFATRLPLAP